VTIPTTGSARVRILLVDDQPLVRASLRMVVTDAPDLEVVAEAGNGAEAVQLARELRPDVVVMDIRMPGMDGLEATRRIVSADEHCRVLILTTFDDDECVYGALRAGASGFLVKDMALDDILGAVRVVAVGDALLAPSVTRRLIADFSAARPSTTPAPATPPAELSAITDRETQVLTLIGQGLSNTEIATALCLSVTTVKTYVSRLLSKLNARDRVQLVILAYEAGLVTTSR